MTLIEELVAKVPMAVKLLEIKGVGIKTVASFQAEVVDISRLSNPKELQEFVGPELVENSSGKRKSEKIISRYSRKRLSYLIFEIAMSFVVMNLEFASLDYYYTSRKRNLL